MQQVMKFHQNLPKYSNGSCKCAVRPSESKMYIKIINTKTKSNCTSKVSWNISQIQSSSLQPVVCAKTSTPDLKISSQTPNLSITQRSTNNTNLSVVLFLVCLVCCLIKPPNNLQFLNLWYYSCIIGTKFFNNRNCIICC